MKILYVAGCGRSGSTLLDLVLGTSPNAFSVGQLENLLYFLRGRDERRPGKQAFRDDQGRTADESAAWGAVKREGDARKAKIYDPRCPLHVRTLLWSLWRRRPFRMAERFDDEWLYGVILRQARALKGPDVEVVVDSSKNFKRLVALTQSPGLDVYVIHLVRDVRGYVHSSAKRGTSWLSALWRWMLLNAALAGYLPRTFPPDKVKRVSYDRFTEDPAAVVREINAWAGLRVAEDGFLPALAREPSYRFSGSGMRFKAVEAIVRDLSWKTNLPRWKQWTIMAFAGRLNRKWVYPEKEKRQ